ncbi:hypothetical protein [Mesobacillus foraminis]|uniref:hypothetical protein n=1 Tax=Mesobacillus foraminis TaxID=279826 RepID=UPI0013CF2D6F|nr:hypothetical protein [Mesobacillus foraminis]
MSFFGWSVHGAVDFRSRRFAFRGLALSLLVASSCGVSPVQLIPQESAHLPLQSTAFLQSFLAGVQMGPLISVPGHRFPWR